MLNPVTKERELAYIVAIDAIEPIVGSDNCEAAVVGGWKVMVRKNTFQIGDLAVYFEIDSKVPEAEIYQFLASKHYKVKTQKYTFGGKGNFISQGLLMHPSDFGWSQKPLEIYSDTVRYIETPNKKLYCGDFLTAMLNVTYADFEDNKRKAKSDPDAKYKSMMNRHPKLAKSKFGRWAMKHQFMKKILFVFLGKKRDKKTEWPNWVVKTDEERIQNLVPRIPEFLKENWIATEKIDGTSTTFTMKGFGFKRKFYVCSRNVVFDKPDKKCFYDTNVYTEMAEKYDIENVLSKIMETMKPKIDFVTIQGETYGKGIQNRDYSVKGHDFVAFNVIFGYKDGTKKRLNPVEMEEYLKEFNIPTVPNFGLTSLPKTCDEILTMAGGASKIDGLPREGLVFRTVDGVKSFKAVDNDFLIQYHR